MKEMGAIWKGSFALYFFPSCHRGTIIHISEELEELLNKEVRPQMKQSEMTNIILTAA